MYESTGICSTVVGTCALLLPDTKGNSFIRVVALTAIAVGAAILVSSIVRAVVKRAYKA